MTDGFILGLIVLLMAWAAIRVRGRKPESWLPRELRRAQLFAVEQAFVRTGSPALVARPDRVYRRRDGCLVPVDLKVRTHLCVHDTDVAQLSLDALGVRTRTWTTWR